MNMEAMSKCWGSLSSGDCNHMNRMARPVMINFTRRPFSTWIFVTPDHKNGGHMTMHSRIILLLMISLFGQMQSTRAEDLIYSGVSYLSNYADIPDRFPYVSRILGQRLDTPEANNLIKNVREGIAATTIPGVRVQVSESIDSQNTGQSISMAISGESCEVQNFEGKYLAIYDLWAHVFIYDSSPGKKQLIASWPVRVRFSDLVDQPPSDAEKEVQYRKILFDRSDKGNLINNWLDALSGLKLGSNIARVKVESVVFGEKAAAKLPSDESQQIISHVLAQFMESSISQTLLLPIIPFSAGQAIANSTPSVQLVFHGEQESISLPNPDFSVRLIVRDLRKESRITRNATVHGYGAFVTLTANDQLGSTPPLLEAKLKKVLTATIPNDHDIAMDDWPQWRQTLFSLIDEAVKQIKRPDSAWLTEASSTPEVTSMFRAFGTRLKRLKID